MMTIAARSSTTATVVKNTFSDSGTRLPSSDKTPSENAMSVAAGMAQPLTATGSLQVIHA